MEKTSFSPMKFGSKKDLEIALTELKWIKQTTGKTNNNFLKVISEKYEFPVNYLKKSTKGFIISRRLDDFKKQMVPNNLLLDGK